MKKDAPKKRTVKIGTSWQKLRLRIAEEDKKKEPIEWPLDWCDDDEYSEIAPQCWYDEKRQRNEFQNEFGKCFNAYKDGNLAALLDALILAFVRDEQIRDKPGREGLLPGQPVPVPRWIIEAVLDELEKFLIGNDSRAKKWRRRYKEDLKDWERFENVMELWKEGIRDKDLYRLAVEKLEHEYPPYVSQKSRDRQPDLPKCDKSDASRSIEVSYNKVKKLLEQKETDNPDIPNLFELYKAATLDKIGPRVTSFMEKFERELGRFYTPRYSRVPDVEPKTEVDADEHWALYAKLTRHSIFRRDEKCQCSKCNQKFDCKLKTHPDYTRHVCPRCRKRR